MKVIIQFLAFVLSAPLCLWSSVWISEMVISGRKTPGADGCVLIGGLTIVFLANILWLTSRAAGRTPVSKRSIVISKLLLLASIALPFLTQVLFHSGAERVLWLSVWTLCVLAAYAASCLPCWRRIWITKTGTEST